MKIDIVVTRHPGLLEYLQDIGIADEKTVTLSHATPDDVRGKHVAGVLPHSLSCLTRSYTEVPLDLPRELRGAELTVDEMHGYVSGPPVTYRVISEDYF
jgi:hypothetical protein